MFVWKIPEKRSKQKENYFETKRKMICTMCVKLLHLLYIRTFLNKKKIYFVHPFFAF